MTEEKREFSRRKVVKTASGAITVPTFVTAVSASEGDQEVIEFEELSKEGKKIFRRALKSKENKEYPVKSFPEALITHSHVVYEGQKFALNTTYYMKPQYRLEPTEVQNIDEVPEVRSTKFEQLNKPARKVFNRALSEGKHKGSWEFPSDIGFNNQFIEKSGTIYDTNLVHHDMRIYSLSPEKVQS